MVMVIGILEHDASRDTAGTGGIKYIARKPSTKGDEGYIYTVSGLILPPIKRKNYQGKSRYFQISELGLDKDWELAHLWPPRFGDESAAGIMAAPRHFNQHAQNHGVERWLQDIAQVTQGPIRIAAQAANWSNEYLRSLGNPDYGKTEILKWVRYTVVDCPVFTQTPEGLPLNKLSIKIELDAPRPGYMPKIILKKIENI